MKVVFDRAKDEANILKHGISLSRAAEMEIISFLEDARQEYGEVRYRAWGLIDGQYHCLAFTYRQGCVRAISLRRAHQKEIKRYAP